MGRKDCHGPIHCRTFKLLAFARSCQVRGAHHRYSMRTATAALMQAQGRACREGPHVVSNLPEIRAADARPQGSDPSVRQVL